MSTITPAAPSVDESTTADHWFARLGRFSARRRKPLILLWLVVACAAAPLAITVSGVLSGAGWEAQGSIGERNWWIPNWLDRRLPRIHFSH